MQSFVRATSMPGKPGAIPPALLLISTAERTYNRGPHQLMHILRFRHGKLFEIKTAGYGS